MKSSACGSDGMKRGVRGERLKFSPSRNAIDEAIAQPHCILRPFANSPSHVIGPVKVCQGQAACLLFVHVNETEATRASFRE